MRSALLIFVALLATPAFAAEEGDEEAPAAEPVAVAPAPGALNTAPATGDQQKLVSGAPLYNPNVAAHVVEKKELSDKWSSEVTLYPAAVQVNGKFTQHLGAALSFTWHLQENFALMAMGMYNYLATESGFNGELIDKVRSEAQAASSLLLVGGVLGGVEVTPFYGKFVFYDSYLVHFAVVLSAGAGAGSTRHQLKPKINCNVGNASNNCVPDPTYGDTGWRFLGELGGGFRVQFMRWLTLRLELRDIVYTARVDQVNGCNVGDLKMLDASLRDGNLSNLSAGCQASKFDGTDPSTGRKNSDDVPLAYALVKESSSDVLNNLGLYVGLSLSF